MLLVHFARDFGVGGVARTLRHRAEGDAAELGADEASGSTMTTSMPKRFSSHLRQSDHPRGVLGGVVPGAEGGRPCRDGRTFTILPALC